MGGLETADWSVRSHGIVSGIACTRDLVVMKISTAMLIRIS